MTSRLNIRSYFQNVGWRLPRPHNPSWTVQHTQETSCHGLALRALAPFLVGLLFLHHFYKKPYPPPTPQSPPTSRRFNSLPTLSSPPTKLTSSLIPLMAACKIRASRMGICESDPHSRIPNTTDRSFYPAKLRRSTFCDCSFMEEFEEEEYDLWAKMQDEARSDVEREPILSSYYHAAILCHQSLEIALANYLSLKLSSSSLPSGTLIDIFASILNENEEIVEAVKYDLTAAKKRDPACTSYVHCFLNFKGFLAIQAHRIAHKLWSQGRKVLALLINNRVSEVFAVDIHPGAKIGRGILLDHATGVVVGETAVIGNNVSILHNVTLGGTGKASGDRHPKIGDGVLIGAGTCILGNLEIGEGAKIGAGSVVLKEVPSMTTAVGNPARLLGGKDNPKRLDKIPSFTMDHTSHIHEWSDYVI